MCGAQKTKWPIAHPGIRRRSQTTDVAGLRTIGAIGGAGVDSLCMRLAGSARGIIGGSRSKPIPLGLDSGSACHYQHLPLFCGADVYPYRRLQNSAKHAQRGHAPRSQVAAGFFLPPTNPDGCARSSMITPRSQKTCLRTKCRISPPRWSRHWPPSHCSLCLIGAWDCFAF